MNEPYKLAHEGNRTIWDAVKQPPQTVLKTILAGRLKGKSDINPQWRYEVMTEVFGPCGVGWKYRINKVWQEPATDNQVFAFASVSVKYRIGTDGEENPIWSEPIEGCGGSMLITQETNKETKQKYLYANDEGYKMAITDALGTALKMIGVAADIYAGKWDGSKYAKEVDSAKLAPSKDPLPRVDGMGNDVPEDVPEEVDLSKPIRGTKYVKILDERMSDNGVYWDSNKAQAFAQWLKDYPTSVDGTDKPKRTLLSEPDILSMTIGDMLYLTEIRRWNSAITVFYNSLRKKAKAA